MSGHFERQADRHADEMGRLDRIDSQVDREWDNCRDDLAELLARGEPIKAHGKPLLDFSDVTDRMAFEHNVEQDACFRLAATHPDLAGHHMKKLVLTVCEELIDLFADELKDDIREDIAA